MKNNKILFIVGASYVSGLEIISLHLIRALKENGYEVRVLVNGWNDGVFKESLSKLNVPFYEVKLGWIYLTKPAWTLDTLLHWPSAFASFRKILRDFGPDICHFSNYSAPIMLFPLLKKRKSLYSLHESHLPSRSHLIIYKLLNKRMQVFTAVSGHISKVLLRLGIPESKIRLIYNGLPAAAEGKREIRPTTFIGIIGQVAQWKGHDTLLEAVEKLAAAGRTNLKVYIYGNDTNEYAKNLKTRIRLKNLEEYFVWVGFVKDQDAIYEQLDIVVVPSLSEEPCSLTILEAMMRGKGVIASDRGGNIELVNDGVNGMIFRAGDANDLADLMERLLKNNDLITELGRKARERALTEFTVRRMTNEFITVYEAI